MMRVNGQNVHSEVPCIKHPSSLSHLFKHQIALSFSLRFSLLSRLSFLFSPAWFSSLPTLSFFPNPSSSSWVMWVKFVLATFHLSLPNRNTINSLFDNSWLFYSNFGLGYIKRGFLYAWIFLFLVSKFCLSSLGIFFKNFSAVIFFSFPKFTSIQMTKQLQNYAFMLHLTTGHYF